MRRIYREYAAGSSLRTIVRALNREGIPFPAKPTKRGPARKGWAVSAVGFILRNPTYEGCRIWNRLMFMKDPESGKRQPVARPESEWIIEERPELRIVDEALAAGVHERIELLKRSGAGRSGAGKMKANYSRLYLLTGFEMRRL